MLSRTHQAISQQGSSSPSDDVYDSPLSQEDANLSVPDGSSDDERLASGSGSSISMNSLMFADLPPASSTPDLSMSGSSPHGRPLSVFSSAYSPEEAYPAPPLEATDELDDGNNSQGSSAFLQCLDRLLSELAKRSDSSCSTSIGSDAAPVSAVSADDILQPFSGEPSQRSTAGGTHESLVIREIPADHTLHARLHGSRDSGLDSVHSLFSQSPSTPLNRTSASDRTSLKRKSSDIAGTSEYLASSDSSQDSNRPSVESEDPASDSVSVAREDANCRGAAYTKRRRLTRESLGTSGRASSRIYAVESATLRKARSLRSEASLGENATALSKDILNAQKSLELRSVTPTQSDHSPSTPARESASDLNSQYVRTAPATPILSPRRHHSPTLPLPVPPAEYIPRPPLCDEDAAERRIGLLLEREAIGRIFSGLHPLSSAIESEENSQADESEDDSEGATEYSVSEDEVSIACESEEYSTDGEGNEVGISQNFETEIHDGLRAEALQWILTVIPPYDPPTTKGAKPSIYSKDLYDQLMYHPDTRFLAAYLFGRYFLSIADQKTESAASSQSGARAEFNLSAVRDDVASDQPGQEDRDVARKAQLNEGERRLVWDLAVAAVTLGVKANRDFLPPLRPIYARDFLVLAPHDMCYDDLEHAQRDILDALSYRLAIPTPQGFMDELYALLPALRRLFGRCGWERLKCTVWKQLFAAVLEPDVFRFPISVLTAAALQLSLARGDACGAEDHAGCCCAIAVSNGSRGPSSVRIDDRYILRQREGVLKDIQQALRISQTAMDDCKRWLAPLRIDAISGIEWFDHASST